MVQIPLTSNKFDYLGDSNIILKLEFTDTISSLYNKELFHDFYVFHYILESISDYSSLTYC